LPVPFNNRGNPSSLSWEPERHAVRVCGLKVSYSIYQMIKGKSYGKRTLRLFSWGQEHEATAGGTTTLAQATELIRLASAGI